MAKIKNDKYYTPPELAKYVVKKTCEIIGEENISEFIEPSGGNGVFLDFLPNGTYSCDIEPEDDRIEEQNYLELDLEYKKGRCVIGNPPFGTRNTLSVKFYKKSIQVADYISLILPISQLNNNQQMYEFDMIYSEDLGERQYSDRKVHCCLNIYKRPLSGFNNKPKYKLKDVKIIESRLGSKKPKEYDLKICAWGGTIGKILTEEDKDYAKEFYLIINNDKFKDLIINKIKEAKWEDIYPMTKTPNLLQWQVYKYLKEQIPELE